MSKLFGIPTVNGLKDFSLETNISEYTLYRMSRVPEKYYKIVEIPKGYGKETRVLACPSQKLKAIQAWILRMILDNIKVHSCAMAYTGLKLNTSLTFHGGNKYILCMDVKNFFPSTSKERVLDFFKKLGYSDQAALLFTKFCTYGKGLPQGGVTSPSLSNLINYDLDVEISSYCNLKNIPYTRYADDITISANNKDKLIDAQQFVYNTLNKYGYELNDKKTRYLHPGKQRKVVGLLINNHGQIGIGQKKRKILRSKIFHLENKINNENEFRVMKAHIVGWMSFLKSEDIYSYNKLEEYWRKLRVNISTKQASPYKE